MTTPAWWDRARRPSDRAAMAGGAPVLVPGGTPALVRALWERRSHYVPDWRPGNGTEDAGEALVRLFGSQLEPVLARVERLGERALVEFLSAAGVSLGAARPAIALLAFTAASAAPRPVQVPERFQVTSPTADGSPGDVTWETTRSLFAVPGEVAEMLTHDGTVLRPVVAGESVRPFGLDQRLGSYLLLGLDTPIAPEPTLTLGLLLAADAAGPPAPVAEGGEAPPDRPRPTLVWEALVGSRFQPMEVVVDDTAAVTRGGVVQLRCPRGWAPERPDTIFPGPPRRWLRLRLAQGRHTPAPVRIASVLLNLVPAIAARTVIDEVPTPLGGREPGRYRLSQAPVLAGSLILEVEEGEAEPDEIVPEPDIGVAAIGPGWRRWQEVKTLVGRPGDARVFVLDPATGVVSFGDNREGRAPPAGVRNIVARRYRVATGRAGAVEAGAISRPVRSVPFLQGVSNPLPASGGADAESLVAALRRGPGLVRARGRAVTASDMALMAVTAPGADIARAFALPGVDPSMPGLPQPGVVGLFVVPVRRPGDRSLEPPMPAAETLRAVAGHLARELGPLGARVVAAAPRWHRVRIEAIVELDPAADVGASIGLVLDALDRYFDPYLGGEADEGWSLGAAIQHPRLLRRVLDASSDVRAVPHLAIVVDGLRRDPCEDAPLAADGLPWPVGHEVVPLVAGTGTAP
ncbi:MAG: putative baseplate assembly protein [Hyphomicrobiaceae bacterium]